MADERTEVSETGVAEAWVRRPWCVWAAVGLVVLGAVLNAGYLWNACPLDLSGDEAHYWEWSRHLDYGYYSKPPGIAWVIWAALRVGAMVGINGDGGGAVLMPVMRMAAVLFGLMTGMLSLFLARRMFRDDRAALGVIGLSAAVPMFAVGSLLITIDSPMYLSWAGTVYCLWRAAEMTQVERGKAKWMYLAGVCAGLGMLFKPVLIALPLCCVVGALVGGRGGRMRQAFFSWPAVVGLGIMLSSQVPVVVWNGRHDWVMFKHIGTQGFGAGPAKSFTQQYLLDPLSRMGNFVGGQAGGMGGIMFGLFVVAVWAAWGKLRRDANEATRLRWGFLLSFTVPLWGFYFAMNLWKGTELNWPAASYFSGMILLAGIFVEGWNAADGAHRRVWRIWGTVAVVLGVLLTAGAINAHRAYGMVAEKLQPLAGTPAYFNSWWHPKKWEKPIVDKLMGMDAKAQAIDKVRQEIKGRTGEEPLIISGRYDEASSLSFYLPGHPFVYCIMSSMGGRQNQYDMWPGLNEMEGGRMKNAGKMAIIVGEFDEKRLREALEFAEIGPPTVLEVPYGGVILKTVTVRQATGFQRLNERKGGPF